MEECCRLCLKKDEENKNIFSLLNGCVIVKMVEAVIPNLTIIETDCFPKQICKKCLTTVVATCELRELSLDNEKYFTMMCEEILIDEFQNDKKLNDRICLPTKVTDESNEPITVFISNTRRTDAKDTVSCLICLKVLSRRSLTRHMRSMHSQNGFKEKDYDSKTSHLKCHEPNVDSTPTKLFFSVEKPKSKGPKLKTVSRSCKYCSSLFHRYSLWNEHMVSVHSELYLKEQEIKALRNVGCSFCVERFTTFRLMKLHLKNIHDVDPELLLYYCSHCSFSGNDKSFLEIHIKEKHFGVSGKPYQCIICEKRFMDQKNLRNHLLVRHKIADDSTFFCDQCDFHSLMKSKLMLHIKRVHLKTMKDFLCTSCSIVSKSWQEKRLHHFVHCDIVETLDPDKEMLSCTLCPSQFFDEDDLMQHLLVHEDEADKNKTACILCSKVISSFLQIYEHTKNDHLEKLSYRCLECNRSFYYGKKFLLHIKNHKEKKPLNHLCTKCGCNLPTAPLLTRHMKIEHEKIYKCPHCDDVVYKSVTAFRQHVDGHTNTRKYQCPICPKSYSIRNKFNRHYAFHLNDKMNACLICGKGFERPSSLKIHMQRHNGTLIKSHCCVFCDKKFRSKWARDCHERTHTKEKPFKCEFCSSAYSQKGDYMKHLKVHLGENVYKCTKCTESFRLLQDLNFHKMNNHHI